MLVLPRQASKPALVPIPVNGPFDRVGVQFPGKKYAVVFMDYLMKWPEVFATEYHTALTIAQLFVEHIVSRHGVPAELCCPTEELHSCPS